MNGKRVRQENTLRENKEYTDERVCDVSYDDIRLLKAIKAITNRGNNAEVKRKSNGRLLVYEVTKHISVK